MILVSLYPVCRILAFALTLLFSAVTLCAGQSLCCAQFGTEKLESSCHQPAEKHSSTQESLDSCCAEDDEASSSLEDTTEPPGSSCCSTTIKSSNGDTGNTKDNTHTAHDCDACSLCSQCGASIVAGLAFLSAELLPSGSSTYYPVLYSTVSAVYDITEPPPNRS